MNEQNLKPVTSKSEARERGRKGGIKSAEVRQQRKSLKEELLLLLTDKDTQKKLSVSLIKRAMKYGEKTGNAANKAYEIIRDTIDEKPADRIENDANITVVFGIPRPKKKKDTDGS